LIVFLMTVSHMRAVLSDPGIVPLPKTGLDFSDLHAGRSMPNTVSIPIYSLFYNYKS
jgi:hypothetical protein